MLLSRLFICIPLLVSVLTPSSLVWAQDTTWVQTFTFSDLAKRRDQFVLPPKGDYRKILMYYTLKCDPKTLHDKYNCGEWDYLTHNFIYNHKGLFDSTLQKGYNFRWDNQIPDSFHYSETPLTDSLLFRYPRIRYVDTLEYLLAEVGGVAADTLKGFIAQGTVPHTARWVYSAHELAAAGLKPGPINGLVIHSLSAGSVGELTLRMGAGSDSTFTWFMDGHNLKTRFQQPVELVSGANHLAFTDTFMWTGTDHVIVQLETRNTQTAAEGLALLGYGGQDTVSYSKAGAYVYDFEGTNGYINLGSYPQVAGNNPRTIAVWARAHQFNNGGIFQFGTTGTTLHDWSLRTMDGQGKWRIQLWGKDADVNLKRTSNEWRHYTLTHDGATTKLYLDGKLVRQVSSELFTGSGDLLLGRWAGSFFDGEIAQVRVYDRDLKLAEIQALASQRLTEGLDDGLAAVVKPDSGHSVYVQTGAGRQGLRYGGVTASVLPAEESYMRPEYAVYKPKMGFQQGIFTAHRDTLLVKEALVRKPTALVMYENAANGNMIPDAHKKLPSLPTDTLAVWQANTYTYTIDAATGHRLDSILVANQSMVFKEEKTWYSPTVRYEIGRYITPYGINLSLGPKGFTWVYDVTDYAPLLRDTIDFSAGNLQELIDVRFAFIHGTAPKQVLRIDRIWDFGSYSYKSMSDNTVMAAKTIGLVPGAGSLMARARLTGHGHNSNDGSFPHCCEWKDNAHTLLVNGKKQAEWHIWREDCDLNPVYPQGGNWVGAREGWCPGDAVGDHDIDLTEYAKQSTITLDYTITPVPANNQGMGGGNYVVAAQLFQYSAPAAEYDASIEMVKRPNKWEFYQRINPACAEPLIIVRNLGSKPIQRLSISYGVSGGVEKRFEWTGTLAPGKTTEVALPIDGSYFWVGDERHLFTANILEVNGEADGYPADNVFASAFELPEILAKKPVVIQVKTNNMPEENSYEVRDAAGGLVLARGGFSANTIYRDTLDLLPGCYTLRFMDEGFGLSYWAWSEQGSGTLQVRYADGGLVKNFNPDFGESVYWPFAIGGISTIEEKKYPIDISVYPNPGTGRVQVMVAQMAMPYRLQVINGLGEVIAEQKGEGTGLDLHEVQVHTGPGTYYVRVWSKSLAITLPFVVID
ncbi:MAG: hypothetical protein HYZ16_03000 [Bacteroidetes bacterium]|nr:hypothetical protein [Bacteroidota bacterium]